MPVRRFSCLFLFCLCVSCGPGGNATAPGDGTAVLPSAMYAFRPDSQTCMRLYRALAAPQNESAPPPLAKTLADGSRFSSVKVLCVWNPAPDQGQPDNNAYTEEFWNGRGYATWLWDNQLAYFSAHPFLRLLYSGTLSIGDGYASGRVQVKTAAATQVLVAFCQNRTEGGDSIALLAWATYHDNDPNRPQNGWTYTNLASGVTVAVSQGDTLRFTGPGAAVASGGMRKLSAAGRHFRMLGATDASFTYDYMVDTTEVTQAAWRQVMGTSPSRGVAGDRNPVDNISWYAMVRYCQRKSALDGLEPCYDTTTWMCDVSKSGYRLLTSQEWEYATRAGATTAYFWGGDMDGDYLWYGDNSGTNGSYTDMHAHPVATKLANPWGLYDMVGNLWETCNDLYGTIPAQTPLYNYTGAAVGTDVVMRGGQYGNYGPGLTWFQPASAWHTPRDTNGQVWMGFRCARTCTNGYTIAGERTGSAGFAAQGGLQVYVNDTLFFSDTALTGGMLPPLYLSASAGDRLRLELWDRSPAKAAGRWEIDSCYLVKGDSAALLFPQTESAAGYTGAGTPVLVFADTASVTF
jgi:hypothetical protein